MARTLYGGGSSDVAVKLSSDGDFEPDTTSAADAYTTGPSTTGGTHMTDLAAFQPGTPGTPGGALTTVVAQSDGEILIWGPDPYNGPFWLQYATGPRRQLFPVDLVSRVAALEAGSGGISASMIDAKGDLIVGTANDTAARLAVGANDTVVTADSTQTTGLKYGPAPIAKSIGTAKGDTVGFSASATPVRVAVGSDGQVKTADAASAAGWKWADVPADSGKADTSGSISQFADVTDTAVPAALAVPALIWDYDTNQLVWTDLATLFAGLDGTGRLAAQYRPKYSPDIIVKVEGDPVPSDAGAGGVGAMVWDEAAAPSLVPTSHGTNGGTSVVAATGITKATTSDINVDDWVCIHAGASGEVTLPSTYTVTLAAGAASGGFSSAIESHQTGSAQSNWLIGKCTTAIPSGTNITVKANQNRAEMAIGIVSIANLAASSVVDKTITAAGGSSGTLALTSTSSGTLAQADEVCLVGWEHNCGNPAIRSQDATPGSGWAPLWAEIDELATGSGRGMRAYYKVVSSTAAVSGAVTITTSDGTSGAYAGSGITLKAA